MLTTANELYTYVREGVDQSSTGTITPLQFDVLINAAAIDHIRQFASGAEMNEKMIEGFRILRMAPLVINNTGALAPEGEVFNLPYVQSPALGISHGFLYALNVGVKLYKGAPATLIPCTLRDGWVPARVLRTDQRYDTERDPFWKATNREPYYWTVGNTLRVRAEADTHARQLRLEYLRYPVAISVVNNINPELPPETNQLICDRAIKRRLEQMESPRYPTKSEEIRSNTRTDT